MHVNFSHTNQFRDYSVPFPLVLPFNQDCGGGSIVTPTSKSIGKIESILFYPNQAIGGGAVTALAGATMTVSLDARVEGNKATDSDHGAVYVSNTDDSKIISTLDIVTQGSTTGTLKTALAVATTSVVSETTVDATFGTTNAAIEATEDIDGTGISQTSTGSLGIHQPYSRHKTLILGLAGACAILLLYVVRQYTAVAKARVTTTDMATVKNNSSNFDVRNMRTFTTKCSKLSSLSSPSIILMLLFSMVTVCNSSSCAGCEDLVGAKSGIAWDDGYGDGCAAFATNDYCPGFGADDEGEGAANDKW